MPCNFILVAITFSQLDTSVEIQQPSTAWLSVILNLKVVSSMNQVMKT